MENYSEIKITTRDKLLRAWENSMELTRDFKIHSREIEDNQEVSKAFSEFAEDEGLHAARFRELLQQFQG